MSSLHNLSVARATKRSLEAVMGAPRQNIGVGQIPLYLLSPLFPFTLPFLPHSLLSLLPLPPFPIFPCRPHKYSHGSGSDVSSLGGV